MNEINEGAVPGHSIGSWQAIVVRYQELFLLAALVSIAFGFRLWLIPTYEVISVDGTGYATAARQLLHGDMSQLARYGFYPVLIALVHLVISDLELSGRLVSAIMGALLILPTYYLGITFFDRRVALCAAILTIAWPDLVLLSGDVMTQATFNTLAMTGVLFTWRAFTRQNLREAILAGFILGLAYATRTEAIILALVLCIPPLAPAMLSSSPWRPLLGKVFLPFAGGFMLILLPNLLLVHEATGAWQLAVKTSGALRDGLMYYLELPTSALPPELDTVGYWDVLRSYPGYIPYSIAKNLKATWQTMLPAPLWILALIGFLAGGWQRQATIQRFFLAATFAPFLIIIIFYYVGPGYFQSYLPVMFLWIGRGLTAGEDRLLAFTLPQPFKQIVTYIHLPIIIVSCLTAVGAYRLIPDTTPQVVTSGRNELDGRLVQKELGMMVKRSLPEGKIMTRWARSAFYAEREWADIDARETIPELLTTARKSNCRFLLVDQMAALSCPQIEPLFAPAGELLKLERPRESQIQYLDKFNYQPYPGLQLHMLYRNNNWVVAAIYQILPEQK